MASDKEASAAPSESLFRRFLSFLGLVRPPDTAEEIEQEIHDILEEGEEQGLISPEEGQMIASIFELKETLAHEIMTPRTDMVAVEGATVAPEIIQLIIDKGFSRLPVYNQSPDHVIGILHAKDLLPYCLDGEPVPNAAELAKPAVFVQEDRRIVELLRTFQNQKLHMAMVTDEFGAIRGLVTLEDIVEEIVGEISDEYDKADLRWKEVDPHTLLTDAKVDVEEVEKFFGIKLPEGPYESVGGLIIHQLDRVPEPGTTLLINSLIFEVVTADKRRVKTVKIQKKSG